MGVSRVVSVGGRVLVPLVLALGLGVSACGGGSDDGSGAAGAVGADEREVRAVYDKYMDDLVAGDGAGACEALTARMRSKAVPRGESCEERMVENGDAVRRLPQRPRVLAVRRVGDEYRARTTTGIGESILWFRQEGGGWKIHRGTQ